MSTCFSCKKTITGKKLIALEKNWHPEHFTCVVCNQPIKGGTFNQHEGNPVCEDDYARLYQKKCAHCNGPINDKYIKALQQIWHQEHFLCTVCNIPLAGLSFLEKDGKAYCEDDYHNRFAPRCNSCREPIRDLIISALGVKWHQDCFTCQICKKPMRESTFQMMQGGPQCKACASSRAER